MRLTVGLDVELGPDGAMQGSIGSAAMGPTGLLQVLETHLGLTAPRLSATQRAGQGADDIAAWLRTQPEGSVAVVSAEPTLDAALRRHGPRDPIHLPAHVLRLWVQKRLSRSRLFVVHS